MSRRVLFFLLPLAALFAETDQESYKSAIKSFLFELFENTADDSQDSLNTTSHTIQLESGPLTYTAIAGTLPQFTAKGEEVGQIFFTAYLKGAEEEIKDRNRPITFIFNGGPGGSCLSMHIGGLGPRRIAFPEEGQKPLPPYKMVDNQETLLESTDLIFIDPIGTGYSRAEHKAYEPFFYSVEGDLSSFAEFIRVFCVHFERWNSPKYLLGASYGTTRACGLAETLAAHGIHLNGIVLMSCAIDYSTVFGQRDQPLSDCLHIPTLAATAWYHKRAMQDKTLPEAVEYARRFTYEQYAPVMLQPSRLNQMEKRAFYQNFADLIGLPVDIIRRYDARIDEKVYVTEFFASDRKILGGCDSRYVGNASALAGEYIEDPSYRNIRPVFYPAFLNYLQNDLKIKTKSKKYTSFNTEAFLSWNWQTYDTIGLPNFLQRLRQTLVANPHMKVFVGSGYYDIRTPLGAAEYSLEHLELPDSYRKNFQIEYYEAGHGFIFDLPSLKKFKKDLLRFYNAEISL